MWWNTVCSKQLNIHDIPGQRVRELLNCSTANIARLGCCPTSPISLFLSSHRSFNSALLLGSVSKVRTIRFLGPRLTIWHFKTRFKNEVRSYCKSQTNLKVKTRLNLFLFFVTIFSSRWASKEWTVLPQSKILFVIQTDNNYEEKNLFWYPSRNKCGLKKICI